MTDDSQTRRSHPALKIVPVIAALYLTAGCAGFWEQPAKRSPGEPLLRPEDSEVAQLNERLPQPDPDFVAICADPLASERVEDEKCGDAPQEFAGSDYDAYQYATTHNADSGSLLWYYYRVSDGRSAPAIRGRLSGGTFTTPRSYVTSLPPIVVRGGAISTTGGPVTKTSVDPRIQRGGLGAGSNTGTGAGGSRSASSSGDTGSAGGGKSGGS